MNYDVLSISSDSNTIIKTAPLNKTFLIEEENKNTLENSISNTKSSSQKFEESSYFNKGFLNSNNSSLKESSSRNLSKSLYLNNRDIQDKEYPYNTLQVLNNSINLAHKANSFHQEQDSTGKDFNLVENSNKQLKKDQQFEKKLEKLRRAYKRRKRQAENLDR